jgi:hypothetical protein
MVCCSWLRAGGVPSMITRTIVLRGKIELRRHERFLVPWRFIRSLSGSRRSTFEGACRRADVCIAVSRLGKMTFDLSRRRRAGQRPSGLLDQRRAAPEPRILGRNQKVPLVVKV